MKVYMMTDMEGVAGVISAREYCRPEGKHYDYGRELATLEVNAAVEGLLEAGATDILVVDGHGPGALNPSLVHPEAKVLTGTPRPVVFPLDPSFDVAVMVGQHARSSADGGHLCHTGSFDRERATINGVVVGEIGINMLIAGYFGVPYIMLTGDRAACDEYLELARNGTAVAVKEGVKRGSTAGLTGEEARQFNVAAIHLSPTKARQLIHEGAKRAVGRLSTTSVEPLTLNGPYEFVRLTRPDENGRKRRAVVTGDDLVEVMETKPTYEDVEE